MTTRNMFNDIGNFHEKFGLDNVTHRGVGPRELPHDLIEFRLKFLKEELQELIDGYQAGNIEKVADSLVDLVVVALGTAHLEGLPWPELWAEVQRANMAKERAQHSWQSARGSTWDIVKPEGWQPPNIRAVLERHGWKFKEDSDERGPEGQGPGAVREIPSQQD